jgi:glycosyltransferase involved in cell wall biosynthesis
LLRNDYNFVMTSRSNIGLVYLGVRGGGAQLTQQLLEEFQGKNLDCDMLLSSGNELLQTYTGAHSLTIFKSFKKKWLYLVPLSKYERYFDTYIKQLKDSKVKIVLFTMAHPLNIQLMALLKKEGIKTVILVHDFRRHPGELWPSSRHIKKFISNSDVVISLSSFVHKAITSETKKVILSDLPTENPHNIAVTSQYIPYCLFIGRIKRYKGVTNLIRAWVDLKPTDVKLLIAGEGRIPRKTRQISNILTLNKWLSNEEIHQLVANASFLILPYIEASQSGILKVAAAYNKPCVVTPVGALTDYYNFGYPCIISKNTEKKAIQESLQKALDGLWDQAEKKIGPPSITEIMIRLISKV